MKSQPWESRGPGGKQGRAEQGGTEREENGNDEGCQGPEHGYFSRDIFHMDSVDPQIF